MDSNQCRVDGDCQSADNHVCTDAEQYFKPFVRRSPPWTAYEIMKTAFCAVFLMPFRVLYLMTAGIALWVIAHLAMLGIRDKEDFLNKPLSRTRKVLLNFIYPVVRSILFCSFGVYRIQDEKLGNTQPCSSKSEIFSRSDASDIVCARLDGANVADISVTADSGSNRHILEEVPNPHVVVANHLGYIDIIVLLAKYRGSFVAKESIENLPFVGIIATAIQCMFVRNGRSLTSQLVDRVRKTHRCHTDPSRNCPGCPSCMSNLIIFPEGTTCNGTAMIPFRSGVFNAGLPVLPVCIRFPHKHFNLSWESIRFREHLFRTMTQFRNDVCLTELPTYCPTRQEKENAKLFAFNVQNCMLQALKQSACPLNRQQKFLYHDFLRGKLPLNETISKANVIAENDATLQYYIALTARNCESAEGIV